MVKREDVPMQTPLVDHLRSVPKDFRAEWPSTFAEDGRAIGHTMSPLGKHSHEAADRIETVERERDALVAYLDSRSVSRRGEGMSHYENFLYLNPEFSKEST